MVTYIVIIYQNYNHTEVRRITVEDFITISKFHNSKSGQSDFMKNQANIFYSKTCENIKNECWRVSLVFTDESGKKIQSKKQSSKC